MIYRPTVVLVGFQRVETRPEKLISFDFEPFDKLSESRVLLLELRHED